MTASFWIAGDSYYAVDCAECGVHEEYDRPRRARRDAIAAALVHANETGHEASVTRLIGWAARDDA